jgi:hypothetical protein
MAVVRSPTLGHSSGPIFDQGWERLPSRHVFDGFPKQSLLAWIKPRFLKSPRFPPEGPLNKLEVVILSGALRLTSLGQGKLREGEESQFMVVAC